MLSTLKKNKKQYAQNTLEEAVRMVQAQEISLSKASAQFRIPKGTLHNKIHGKTALRCKKGPKTLLSDAEEKKICFWILNMAKIGYPVNAKDVRETVANILEIKGSKIKPGKKWMQLFLKRHPQITKRHAEIISKARALVTEPMIRKWFQGLREYLQEENADDILNYPERIFNLDETGVQLCPKTGVVLAPKNYRAMYDVAPGQEKQSVTVLCNFSASGGIVPPFIVYPMQRISKELAQSVPDEWGIGRSDSGWMTGQTFLNYMKEIFLPWLHKKNIELPILLLVDGHKSHINMELHEFCIQNKIILYCLHPNTTHILQPCDVGIFGPLKAAWKTATRKYKHKNNAQITRSNFAKVFAESFEISMKKTVIVNAFKACGIYPFNPDSVDYSKCISHRQEEIENDISTNDYKITVDVIEKILHKNILDKYKEYRRRNKTCKSSLFKFWNKCKNKLDNISLSQSSNIDDSAMNSLKIDDSNPDKHARSAEISSKPSEQFKEDQLLLTTHETHLEEREWTLGTNTFIEGIMDVEHMPIEIEGVTVLLDEFIRDANGSRLTPSAEILTDGNQKGVMKLQEPHSYASNLLDLTNTESSVYWVAPQTSSTPVSSQAIPLPWYTENEEIILDKPQQVIRQMDELLRLPQPKKGTKRKQSKSPIPLAITSKKFKEYLQQKENEKKNKAEDIRNRKIQREKKKAEKEKNSREKKTKGLKTNSTISKVKTSIDPVNEATMTSNKAVEIPVVENILTNKLHANYCIPETEKTNKNIESLIKDKENINLEDFVVVEFETNKRNRYYVGQVLMCDFENNFIKVKCLRKKASKFDNLTYFVEPSTIDLTEVSVSAITKILPSPRIGRRGMITFENAQFDLNLCE